MLPLNNGIVLWEKKGIDVHVLLQSEAFCSIYREHNPWVACESYRVLIGVEPCVRKELCDDGSGSGAHRGWCNNAPSCY